MPTPVTAWSPPLPEASGFDHLVVQTPGLRTHVAAIGEGEPVVLLHGDGPSSTIRGSTRDAAP